LALAHVFLLAKVLYTLEAQGAKGTYLLSGEMGEHRGMGTKVAVFAYRGNELDVDEEYDNDGGLALYESRQKRGTRDQQVRRQKAAQIADYRCGEGF
jgi:hypothetical protein